MTIRLLATYNGNPPNTIVTLAGGTETALVAAGNASTDLSGGVAPVYITPANSQVGDVLYGPDGVPLGIADPTGKLLLLNFNGITVPGAPTGLTLTAIAGGVLAAFTPSATLGGTVGTGFEVTLSNGRVQRGAASPIVVNSPVGAVTATVKQINGAGLSAASTASASATVTAYTAPTIPGAPTGLTLTAGNGKVTASWTAAAANGSAIRDTIVTLSNGASATALGSATTVDVATPAGIPVTATARANNGEGAGPTSAVSNSVTPTSGAGITSVDVLVYGATWQGVVAAIKAKQAGLSYMLLSERDDLGGMMTSGIQLTDALSFPVHTRASIPKDSLTNELFERLAVRYGKNQQAMYRDQSYSSESKGTLAEIQAIMTKYGVVFTPGAYLTAMSMVGGKIDTATFSGIGAVRAKVFVDTSYTSDLLAKTGADWYLGSEALATYGESAQGAGWYTGGGQPANPVDPYIVPGDSASGTIKYVAAGALPAAGTAVPNKVQAMGFRLSVTQQAGQKVAFPAPANYVASDYELHRRWFAANGSGVVNMQQAMNLQVGFGPINSTTSTSKYDANTSGFISLDFPDVNLSSEYALPTTTLARRREIEEIIRQYTLGYLYFLQNDSSVPSALRTNAASYGFCSDDYISTGGMPPRAYCREGIRAVGDVAPVTALDIAALNTSAAPVAFSNYAYDAHIRQYVISPTTSDRVFQEGHTPISMTQSMPMARIDMKILFPKKAQASNLVLTWGGNMTRQAYCAIRVEPVMGVLAETAGIVAVVAAQQGIAVQDVNYATDIAPKLPLFGNNKAGAVVMAANGQWNTGTGTISMSGFSLTTLANSPYGLTQAATCALTSGTNYIEFTPNIPTTGTYDVQVKYIDSTAVATRGTINVVVTAQGAAQTPTAINETSTANTCGDWQTVGSFTLAAGISANNRVRITHDNTANSSNVLAVRFVPV